MMVGQSQSQSLSDFLPVVGRSPSVSDVGDLPRSVSTEDDDVGVGISGNARERERSAAAAAMLRTPDSISETIRSSAMSCPDRNRLVTSYYQHFHLHHPMLVPRKFFDIESYPEFLEEAVCLIGKIYVSRNVEADEILEAASAVAGSSSDLSDVSVSHVQALLIYGIVLHTLQHHQEAYSFVARASEIATALHMDRAEFASAEAFPQPRTESFRRTLWELYAVEAFMAGLHRTTSKLSEIGDSRFPDPPFLPGIDETSAPQQIHTLSSFEARFFDADPHQEQYSVGCYRIDSIRILHRVLKLSNFDSNTESYAVQSIDDSISGWFNHLPPKYSDVVDEDGIVDPILVQAYFFLYCASIFLHYPRSDLAFTRVASSEVACVESNYSSPSTGIKHTTKALEASKGICRLAAIPNVVEKSSPLFVCAVVLATIVELAYISNSNPQPKSVPKDRLILLLGVLLRLARRWSTADVAARQLRILASSILNPEPATTTQATFFPPTPAWSQLAFDFQNASSWMDFFQIDTTSGDQPVANDDGSFPSL